MKFLLITTNSAWENINNFTLFTRKSGRLKLHRPKPKLPGNVVLDTTEQEDINDRF